MRRISYVLVSLGVFFANISLAQTITINGTVYATTDIEGIHIINKTARKATTTNEKGFFSIQAKLQDTLVFSGVQYKLHTIVVDTKMVKTKAVKVFLIENINQLEEVVVGEVLTGDLLSDIENSKAEPDINFYDVGIPGYKGKPKTQNERRLADADGGKFFYYYGIGFSLNFYKILNRINGNTKELKQRVKLETRDELMYRVKAKFSEDLFADNPLDEALRYEFFFFCSEAKDFTQKCSTDNTLEIMSYLQEKLKQFKDR